MKETSTRLNSSFNLTVFLAVLVLSISLASALDPTDYLFAVEVPSSLSNTSATVSGTDYVIYTIGSKDIFVTKGDVIVSDKSEIQLALNGKCLATAYPSPSDLDGISDNIQLFNDSRQRPTSFGPLETLCDMLTGQSITSCDSSLSCLQSCTIGSYACSQFAQGSTLFLTEVTNFAITKHNINSNVSSSLSVISQLKSITDASQLDFNVKERVDVLVSNIASMQTEAINYKNNKLFVRSANVGFEFCVPVGYDLALNNTALASAAVKAASLSAATSCFDDIDKKTTDTLNSTTERIAYFVNTKQKVSIQREFDALAKLYNNLTLQSTTITDITEDAKLSNYVTDVSSLSSKYYTHTSKKEYANATVVVSQMDSTISEFGIYLKSLESTVGSMLEMRANSTTIVNRAALIIGETQTGEELTKIQTRLSDLEARLDSKVSSDEIADITTSYQSIAMDTEALITSKKELESNSAQNVLSSAANGISLSVLNMVAGPLGVKEEQKRDWIASLPLLIILIVDIVLVAIFSIVFFVLVLSKSKKFAKKNVMKTWAMIGVVVLLLLAGLSYALNTVISSETGTTNVFDFLNQIEDESSFYIVQYRGSTQDALPMTVCTTKITSKLQALGKTVQVKESIDGVCEQKLLSECLDEIGSTPTINLRYSDTNSTKFFTFYKVESSVEGNGDYINTCTIADLLQ